MTAPAQKPAITPRRTNALRTEPTNFASFSIPSGPTISNGAA